MDVIKTMDADVCTYVVGYICFGFYKLELAL